MPVLFEGEPVRVDALPGLARFRQHGGRWRALRQWHRPGPLLLVLVGGPGPACQEGSEQQQRGLLQHFAHLLERGRRRHLGHRAQGIGKGRAGLKALAQIRRAGLADHAVQIDPERPLAVVQIIRHLGELHAVLPAAHLIEHLAQAVEIRLRRARPLRRHKALRAHEGALARHGHQANVRQLADAAAVNDVRGLDVAVRQAALVHVVQRIRDEGPGFLTEVKIEPPMIFHVRAERARRVSDQVINVRPHHRVIRQLHHIVIEAALLVPAHVQNVHQPGMPTRDRLELLNALELAMEGLGQLKVLPPHDFHRAQRARDALRQPHLAIRA